MADQRDAWQQSIFKGVSQPSIFAFRIYVVFLVLAFSADLEVQGFLLCLYFLEFYLSKCSSLCFTTQHIKIIKHKHLAWLQCCEIWLSFLRRSRCFVLLFQFFLFSHLLGMKWAKCDSKSNNQNRKKMDKKVTLPKGLTGKSNEKRRHPLRSSSFESLDVKSLQHNLGRVFATRTQLWTRNSFSLIITMSHFSVRVLLGRLK